MVSIERMETIMLTSLRAAKAVYRLPQISIPIFRTSLTTLSLIETMGIPGRTGRPLWMSEPVCVRVRLILIFHSEVNSFSS